MQVTIFKASRTVAREFAKQVQGKVKDMGTDATAGERWAVSYEVADDVQVVEFVKAAAQAEGIDPELVDVRPNQIDPINLKGIEIPKIDAEARVEFENPVSAVIVAAKPYNRNVMKLKAKVQPRANMNKGTLKSRKGNMVEVQFKRSKIYQAMKG